MSGVVKNDGGHIEHCNLAWIFFIKHYYQGCWWTIKLNV